MKQTHSKYRNSGIIFDLLVRQITADTLGKKSSPALNILKEYYTNSELAKEYKLYNILVSSNINESRANVLIETTSNLYNKLNKTALRKQKYSLIKEIKQHYNLEDFFKAKINNYKVYAAIYNLFESLNNFISPELVIQNKVVILEHLIKKPADDQTKSKLMEEYMSTDKGMRFLTYKILVEKFNEKYSNLDKSQKEILREYINNITNTVLLKEYINVKFVEIQKELKQLSKKVTDKATLVRLNEVINIIRPIGKNENAKDEDVLNLLHYSELIKELKELK